MKTLLITTLTLGLSLNASAFFSEKALETSIMKKITSNRQTPPKKVDTCANFSGKWKGTCEKNGNKEEKTETIEQAGCMQIAFVREDGGRDNFDLTGIGLSNKINTGVFISYGFSTGGKWSSDKQVAQVEGVVLVNSPFLQAPKKITFSGQMLMDGADLVRFSKVEGTDNDGDENCRYSKVP